ncbi:MAG: RNA polymerase sigma factor [Chlorobi bacterium]|nr:MAG: ECF subfamily RNA polymerase sigma-70 factor [Chlorobi bacterium OLB7]MBK8910174.1 RNA polymerase sigma factor [Chlorobiota bacterium]MBX7217883.1 RNA polymerase sigma factor [Candidatus Kapabacteria bacterium]
MHEAPHTDGLSDEELMEQFKGGSEQAFVALYKRYNRRVYAYCLKMLGQREAAEDIFQEVFIRVTRKRDHFKSGNFSAWLFAIARNLCLNAIRDNVHHVPIDDVHESAMAFQPAEEYDQSAEILKKAIEKLPNDLREALVLRVYNGFSYNEISEITNTKLATVKVRIFRAKQRLYDILAPYFLDKV